LSLAFPRHITGYSWWRQSLRTIFGSSNFQDLKRRP
jgi:hypothetical protein